MELTFYKYQGTGNDFVVIDNRQEIFPKNDTKRIAQLCDRKFGIGADGLMLLENSTKSDFKMVYYNADGNTSSMCGNGGRCLVAFAEYLEVINHTTTFEATDGIHAATIENGLVNLKMIDIDTINEFDDYLFLNTGSPHHVTFVNNVQNMDVKTTGRNIRNGAPYFEKGSNVNFVEQISNNTFKVRTYERGVEDETLSCGTGVTAVAIASHASKKTTHNNIILETPGGNLEVSFELDNNTYKNVFLKGAATLVFKGTIAI